MDKQKGISMGWVLGIAALVLLAIIILPQLFSNEENIVTDILPPDSSTPVPTVDTTPGVNNVTADSILENPGNFYNRTVSVISEIEDRISPRSFTLSAGGLLADSLLVISGQPIIARGPDNEEVALEEAGTVRVVGTVRQFDRTAVQNELNTVFDEDLDNYEGDPVIILQSIENIPQD